MSYTKITSKFEDHISIDHNSEGALILTALVEDPNDLSGIGPFYHSNVFYFYELDEAIDLFIYQTLNNEHFNFMEED